jgi:hypothetical protein
LRSEREPDLMKLENQNFYKGERIARPIGAVSKNDMGAFKTRPKAVLKRAKEAFKATRLVRIMRGKHKGDEGYTYVKLKLTKKAEIAVRPAWRSMSYIENQRVTTHQRQHKFPCSLPE